MTTWAQRQHVATIKIMTPDKSLWVLGGSVELKARGNHQHSRVKRSDLQIGNHNSKWLSLLLFNYSKSEAEEAQTLFHLPWLPPVFIFITK